MSEFQFYAGIDKLIIKKKNRSKSNCKHASPIALKNLSKSLLCAIIIAGCNQESLRVTINNVDSSSSIA